MAQVSDFAIQVILCTLVNLKGTELLLELFAESFPDCF